MPITSGKKLLEVGGATVDFLCRSGALTPEMLLGTGFERNKIDLDSFTVSTGGGGVNAGRGVAKLGFDSTLLCRVGDDENGRMIAERLRKAGISIDEVQYDPVRPTGVAVSLDIQGRSEALILADRGANQNLSADPGVLSRVPNFDGIYLSSLAGGSRDVLGGIVGAKAPGQLIAVNPGAAQLENMETCLLPQLLGVDLYIANYSEALALWWVTAGRKPSVDQGVGAEISRDFLRDVAAALHQMGPGIVAVTLGSEGVFISVAEGEQKFHPAVSCNVVNETGAGDAFGSTLFAFLSAGMETDIAVRAALINAASVVEHGDTHSGLLSGVELLQKVNTGAVSLR